MITCCGAGIVRDGVLRVVVVYVVAGCRGGVIGDGVLWVGWCMW